jgi:hypothetical protein
MRSRQANPLRDFSEGEALIDPYLHHEPWRLSLMIWIVGADAMGPLRTRRVLD